ncbi:MAG: hypothetical protein COU07_00765 [Candidatus Harrisonbacteria bacterium CG10_big_fil_rev_8_21_14_0_10_40_38]|uniref:CHRD domain-containing protein n=1 Tax=Candidatus Harrisonbacteria bacterium CG10_big_fil_rev_8_21_14_0_10_40_38 TaxID=1974583 RepID=A0A2H0USQ2_9BACT|nr:MAG: hypothetical protein COU07_00765 [Candidatus Harrisonbacteria bacterium CG10_big_fil_rev_8_21_14_0_10_40_38]
MSTRFWTLFGIIIVAVVAIIALSGNTTPKNNESMEEILNNTVLVNLATQNNSGETGTAAIVEENGKIKVLVNISGSPENDQPMHIHEGTCESLGPIKWELNPIKNDASETMLPISKEEIKTNLPLAINVHKSQSELKEYVACGNISSDMFMMEN